MKLGLLKVAEGQLLFPVLRQMRQNRTGQDELRRRQGLLLLGGVHLHGQTGFSAAHGPEINDLHQKSHM